MIFFYDSQYDNESHPFHDSLFDEYNMYRLRDIFNSFIHPHEMLLFATPSISDHFVLSYGDFSLACQQHTIN